MLSASGLGLDIELDTHTVNEETGCGAYDGSGRNSILIGASHLILSLLCIGYAGT